MCFSRRNSRKEHNNYLTLITNISQMQRRLRYSNRIKWNVFNRLKFETKSSRLLRHLMAKVQVGFWRGIFYENHKYLGLQMTKNRWVIYNQFKVLLLLDGFVASIEFEYDVFTINKGFSHLQYWKGYAIIYLIAVNNALKIRNTNKKNRETHIVWF